MSTPCNTYVQVIQNTDPCNGETVNALCIIDSNTYPELGISVNSNQQQINSALYLAFFNFNITITSLQNQINNLQIQINNLP